MGIMERLNASSTYHDGSGGQTFGLCFGDTLLSTTSPTVTNIWASCFLTHRVQS